MGRIHKQEIDTAASWHAADFVGDQSWQVHFTDAEIAALDHAVAAVMARGLPRIFPGGMGLIDGLCCSIRSFPI